MLPLKEKDEVNRMWCAFLYNNSRLRKEKADFAERPAHAGLLVISKKECNP